MKEPSPFYSVKPGLGIQLDIRYATPNNFTGAVLPGYHRPAAWLIPRCGQIFEDAQQYLLSLGYGVVVWDAYRPRRATLAMLEWARRTDQWQLVTEGYIAERSRHNSAAAIDLGLFSIASGQLVDMGSEWDCFEQISHTFSATGEVLEHRLVLRNAMLLAGWSAFDVEWWHFELEGAAELPVFDTPYA